MKKTFPLAAQGKHPDRILDAVKHEIRKYLRRERRRELPEGVDFLDFDCRLGRSAETAQVAPVATLISLVDAAARDGATSVYVEILSKPGHRAARPVVGDDAADSAAGADSGFPATVMSPPDSEFPATMVSPQDSDDPK